MLRITEQLWSSSDMRRGACCSLQPAAELMCKAFNECQHRMSVNTEELQWCCHNL